MVLQVAAPGRVWGCESMSSEPIVIFLPVRNGGDYLREAIDSIVAQTDSDWRLIVLENASTDSSVAVVRGYRDDRISLIPAERPLGIFENWHRGLEVAGKLAGNPLITFIGHDDFFSPGFVAEIKALASSSPDATLYQTLFNLVDGSGNVLRSCRPIAQHENWMDMAAALCWGIRDSFGTGYAFRTDDYRRVGGIPELPRLLYSDHILFTRLARLGSKRCSTSIGCAYRLHVGSASNSFSAGKINDHVSALGSFVDTLHGEFAPFVATDLGRAAVDCLIRRELQVLQTPVIRRALVAANQETVLRLERMASDLSGGTGRAAVFSKEHMLQLARRLKLSVTYLRAQWSERRRG